MMIDETVCHNARLTYTEIEISGPAAQPLDFPSPTVHNASRKAMNVYDPISGEIVYVKNVLYRTPSKRERWGSSNRMKPPTSFSAFPDQAYCIQRKISDAIYGSVRLCTVLKRRQVEKRQSVPCESDASYSSSGSIRSNEEENFMDEANRRTRTGSIRTYHDNRRTSASSRGSNSSSGHEDFVLWEATKERVAIKLISWSQVRQLRGRHLEDPIKEVAAMQLIGDYHPHILGSIEVLQDDKYLYSIVPYCSGGDLFGEIAKSQPSKGEQIDEDTARKWFRQILLGLHHLQKKGVCHRDLSLENIMIHKDKCLIMDMGLCLRVPYSDPYNESCVIDVSAGSCRRLMKAQGQGGKWLYMAPEVVARDDFFDGFAIDLWAAGIILYIMLVGLAPFKWAHESDRRFAIYSTGGLAETLNQHHLQLSKEAVDLLQNMFWRDPRQRLTLAQVFEHPWLTGATLPTTPIPSKSRKTATKVKLWNLLKTNGS